MEAYFAANCLRGDPRQFFDHATDDKRQLTEAERARGVQQMLVLGVDADI